MHRQLNLVCRPGTLIICWYYYTYDIHSIPKDPYSLFSIWQKISNTTTRPMRSVSSTIMLPFPWNCRLIQCCINKFMKHRLEFEILYFAFKLSTSKQNATYPIRLPSTIHDKVPHNLLCFYDKHYKVQRET